MDRETHSRADRKHMKQETAKGSMTWLQSGNIIGKDHQKQT